MEISTTEADEVFYRKTGTMFVKMYVDEPNNWQPIEETRVRQELAPYYRNVAEVIGCIRQGGKARTPWAFYKCSLMAVPETDPPAPCPGEVRRPPPT